MKAIFFRGAPLLAVFSGRMGLLEDYVEQWVVRLTGAPFQFTGNPFPPSGL